MAAALKSLYSLTGVWKVYDEFTSFPEIRWVEVELLEPSCEKLYV